MNYETIVQQAEGAWYAANGYPPDGSGVYSCTQLRALSGTIPAPKHGDEWGNWRLNLRGEPSLDFADGEFYFNSDPYWIELSKLQTDEGLVEWLNHLSSKHWFGHDPLNAGNFINAVFKLRKYVFEKVPRSPIMKAVKKGGAA
jgi:hypothetical protein